MDECEIKLDASNFKIMELESNLELAMDEIQKNKSAGNQKLAGDYENLKQRMAKVEKNLAEKTREINRVDRENLELKNENYQINRNMY